jgi:Zn-finger nucleic acid-binding protein
MHCPVCKDQQLVMSERQGVEIDYCPSCRGVWLDRGELDKLIEKSSAMNVAPVVQQQSVPQPSPQQPYQQPYPHRHDARPYYQKKPKNWLSEFFD